MKRRDFLTSAALIGSASLFANSAVANAKSSTETEINKADFLDITGPGNKFDYDGEALRFRGNSLVSHVPQESEFFKHLVAFQNKIRHSDIGDHHVFLPKNSLHVTIFNGTNEKPADREKPGFWPADLPKEASIQDVHIHYLNKLKDFKPDLPKKLTFKATALRTPFDKKGITLDVELVNEEDKQKIIAFRKALNELTQTTRNVPEKLNFHISLGYTWKKYTPELMARAEEERLAWSQEFAQSAPLLEIDEIEFALFDDMLAFSPLYIYYLNK